MGPVATLQTDGGKIFAGCYALFSGLALITILGHHFRTGVPPVPPQVSSWRTTEPRQAIMISVSRADYHALIACQIC